jgi:hypothetical protein
MRAYLIPIGVHEGRERPFSLAFMQRKDHGLGPDLCDMLLATGGAVESGEDARRAALRELEEEVPGWLFPDEANIEQIYADEAITVFTVSGDASLESARTFIQRTREGVPALLSTEAIRALADDRWVYPQMKTALLARLEALEAEFASA